MIPYYVGAGDFAAAFVIAHEFGHAMQARLPARGVAHDPVGAAGRLLRRRLVPVRAGPGPASPGDLDEATLAVFSARDLPGTDFTDPAAHGSGFERTRAFADGYEAGPALLPRPAADWLVGST